MCNFPVLSINVNRQSLRFQSIIGGEGIWDWVWDWDFWLPHCYLVIEGRFVNAFGALCWKDGLPTACYHCCYPWPLSFVLVCVCVCVFGGILSRFVAWAFQRVFIYALCIFSHGWENMAINMSVLYCTVLSYPVLLYPRPWFGVLWQGHSLLPHLGDKMVMLITHSYQHNTYLSYLHSHII